MYVAITCPSSGCPGSRAHLQARNDTEVLAHHTQNKEQDKADSRARIFKKIQESTAGRVAFRARVTAVVPLLVLKAWSDKVNGVGKSSRWGADPKNSGEMMFSSESATRSVTQTRRSWHGYHVDLPQDYLFLHSSNCYHLATPAR